MVDKNINNEIKKENLLIIYSCEQETTFLYQNISIVNQFIERLKDSYNIYILSSTDTLKLVFEDLIKILVYKKKIDKKLIIDTIKDKKISKIIPIDCSIKTIHDVQKYFNKRIENFFYSYYNSIIKENKKTLLSYAKKSGFFIKKLNHVQIKEFKSISVVAIKDNFDNQIIIDYLERAKFDDDRMIFCNYLNLENSIKLKIKSIIDKFGNLLKIKNYIYTIKFFINNNGDVFYDKTIYGLTKDAIFSIQQQQLNLPQMMLKIYNNISFFKPINNKSISLSYDYDEKFKIEFFNDIQYKNIKIFNKKNVQENESLYKYINKTNNDIVFFRKNDYLTKIKYNNFKTLSDYILICIGDEFVKNINYQIFFYKISSFLSKRVNKKILLLTKKHIVPFMSFLGEHFDVVVCDSYTEKNINFIINKYKIKSAYITPSVSTFKLIKQLQLNDIIIYGLDKNETELICINDEYLMDFCDKINYKCQCDKMDEKEKIINVFCITDKHKNIVYKNIISEFFYGKVNAVCNLNPFLKINHDIEKNINDLIDKIVDNLKSYGLLCITIIYKNGDIIINNITIQTNPMLFFVSSVKNDFIYEILIQSFIGKNIDLLAKKNIQMNNQKFYQKICFTRQDLQNIVIESITKEKVIKKYQENF